MRKRLFLLYSMLCLFGSPPALAGTNNTISVAFINDVGWEQVYVYTWTIGDDQTTEQCGTWPGAKIEGSGDVFIYQCEASNAPANIIFNNGSSGSGNQTEDLVFEAGTVYSYGNAPVNYGADADIYQSVFDLRFASRCQQIGTLQQTAGITAAAGQKLSEAMTAYSGINKNTPVGTQQDVAQQMDDAIAYTEEGLRLAVGLRANYNRLNEWLRNEGSGDAAMMSMLVEVGSALENGSYESNEQISSWLTAMANARTQYLGYEYCYWFDNDYQSLHSTFLTSNEWQIAVDVNGLSESIHAIHLQVSDAAGNQSSVVTRYFIKTNNPATATGHYWFDNDLEHMYTSSQTQGLMDIDVSQLPEGLHSIYYQVQGTNNNISATATRSFFKVYIPTKSKWHCWFDNDEATMVSGTDTSQPLLLDVSGLPDGYHALHVQVEGGAHSASTPIIKPFIKIPQTIGVDDYTCLCMVDDQLFKQEKVSAKQGVVSWNIDVSQLPQGFHRLFVQVVTPSGAASNTYESFFLRETTRSEFAELKCVYAIDGAEFYTEAGTMDDGTFHFDLDVSSLDDGLHRIAYMLSNGKGVTTKAQSQFFVKTPLGGNGITEYWYWLNDQADSNAKKVALSERQDPFSLITLLPVEHQPIRSSLFQFRIENGVPMVYAKNDFHIRFYDAAGRFTDATKQYVDEQVSQAVTDVTLLQRNQRATIDRPAENAIKWYNLTAEPGDSLSFKLDRAATIQLFSPTGKEVFSASGAQSVEWGGIHAEESGTYYAALHDVTATYGNTVSIDYAHIDRYAVLRQDVTTVGNGGPSTITFTGNGFDELTSVDLILDGTTIASAAVEAEGKAKVSVKWDFTDAPLGQYKAVFHFDEGNVTVEKCIIVEEATEISFDEKVTFASQYLRSTKNSYVFKIRNNGNMTAYNVPLAIYIYAPDAEALKSVDISGFDMKSYYKNLLGSKYTDELNVRLTQQELVSGDKCYFLEEDNSEYVEGHPYSYRTFICPDLRPNTTETITVSINATENVYVYMWYPLEWETSLVKSSYRRSAYDGICAIANEPRRQCEQDQWLIENGCDPIYNRSDCDNYFEPDNCPPPPGGGSTPVNSLDPNDIYGYQDEFGSKIIRGGLTDVYYTIEFENDPEFATASAHDIYVTDVLDPTLFDLSTFAPTRIKIGEQEVTLTDEERAAKVVTINMQPAIYAIAQVAWEFDAETGLAEWHISSLDPMTMEPTTVAMDGILPVNNSGNGIGQLSFDISLKSNLSDGTEIPNKATIVFDENDPIETPTWVNTISTADIQMGDVNGDGVVDTQDAIKVIQHYLKKNPADFDENAADVNGDGVVDTQDAIKIIKIYLKKE